MITSKFILMVKLSLCFISLIKYRTMKMWRYSAPHIPNLGIRWMWSDSHPSSFTHEERDPITQWTGGWAGPKAGLNMENLEGIEPFPWLSSSWYFDHRVRWEHYDEWWRCRIWRRQLWLILRDYPGQDLNWMPSEYKSQVLLLHHATN